MSKRANEEASSQFPSKRGTAREAPVEANDPFDESNFVEKKVNLAERQKEAEGWDAFTRSTGRVKKETNVQPDLSSQGPSLREYNKDVSTIETTTSPHVTYEFGDRGSDWRMMKLRSLRETARESGKDVEEVAFERYGSLEKYDEAREEEQELKRRKTYGITKTRPDGSLYQQRMNKQNAHEKLSRSKDAEIVEEIKADSMADNGRVIELGDLNVLKAKLLKAQLRKSPDAKHLQDEYDAALNHYNKAIEIDHVVVLPGMDQRGEALQKDENDMTIEELVREEKRESRTIAQSRRDADKIARDSRFKDDLEYQDENADKLASRVRKKEINLKNTAISDFQKINKILDSCPLCHKDDGEEPPIAPVISLATRTFLSLPSAPLTKHHVLIVPLQHRTNILECDDDEHAEIRNFMKSLTRLYDSLGYAVIFYENNARPYRKSHAAIECVPIPQALIDTVPRYWHEAILSADEEWGQHRPLIHTTNNSFTKKMSSAMPYFHVWFDLNGGLGHIIEDDKRWPKDDLFGRQVVGSILGLDVTKWRRKGNWTGDANSKEEREFKAVWDRWDWTKALIEQ